MRLTVSDRRRRCVGRAVSGVFICAVAAMSVDARADGLITAFACGELPSPAAVEVVSTDDSAGAVALEKRVVAALKARQIGVRPDAPLRLTVEARRVVEAPPARKPDMVEITRRPQKPLDPGETSDYETRVEVNIWSSRRDSLIGGRTSGKSGRILEQVLLEMTINDKRTGICLWQGTAVHDLAGHDMWAEAASMAQPLVKTIGKQANRKPFTAN